MNRRSFLPSILFLLFVGCCSALNAAEVQRPNVLWIIAEDMGVELGCYGEPLVYTPNIDALASRGIRYTNVICTAPVCSAARSALMTGMYQTTIGAHNHRSHRDDGYRLPKGVEVITSHFRKAGYYTANLRKGPMKMRGTGKTDWNFTYKNPYDGDDWAALKKNQPFFAQINFSETHRTFKRSPKHPVDPAKVKLPPYYPDHPVTRKDWALYLETVNVLDEKVGKVLQGLKDDGLADNTIVIFFADHGRAHVRGKQWLYEGGVHVPMLVAFPDGRESGRVEKRMIAHIDIAATSMQLAGIARPKKMEAQSFFDVDTSPRGFVVSARDRCDETVDRIRSVRTPRYKYIRNFYPQRPYTQLNRYKQRQYPVLSLLHQLHAEDKLTPAQQLFMASRRPTEELYDLETDPHEVNNLAASAKHSKILKDLRGNLVAWIQKTGDKGQVPEDPKIIEYWENRQSGKHKIQRKPSGAAKPAKK